jgi:hypothetical protein
MQLCDKGSEQLSDGNSVYLAIVIFYDYLVKQEHRSHHVDEFQWYNVTHIIAKDK